MSKRLKIGLLSCLLAALSTVALGQSFTTFVNARIITQLDLTGTVTANGSTGTAGQALTSNGAGDVTWSTIGGVPGGVNTQVQYNDGGVFGGDAGMTFDETNDLLTIGFGTITGARTNAVAPLLLSSTTTSARWNETDGAVDNKQWEWAANGEQFRLGALTDAGVLGGSAFLIDRTGTVIDTVSYGGAMRALSNGTISVPAYAFTNDVDSGMYLNAVNDLRFTVNAVDKLVLAASGVLTPNIQLQMLTNPLITNVNPILWMQETGVTAENTMWLFNVNAEQLRFQLSNDALNSQTNWLVVDRTLNVADSIALASTALTWNGNTLFTTANDGSGSGLDADLLDGLSSAAFAQLAAANTFTGNMLISKDDPQFNTVDTTGPGADEGRWSTLNQNGTWSLRTRTDADGAGATAIAIGRTGTTVGTVALTGTSVTLNGVASSDFARLSQSNTFTGNTQTITNTSGPRVVLRDPDATADEQCFFTFSQSSIYSLWASSDANCSSTTGASEAFRVTRTGAVVTSFQFQNGVTRFLQADSPAVVVSPTNANITSRSNTTGVVAALQVNGSAATEATYSMTRANGANSAGPILFLNKSRGTVSAPTTVVASGDDIGRIVFSGSDSANFSNGAEISAQVDGTPGAGDMPGRLLFSTTADGATLPTERMRISSTGLVTIAGDATVSGKVTATNGVTATAGVNAGNRLSMSTQSPTSLAADVNNWALTPVPIVLIAASTGGINITGIDATTANADAQSLGNNAILHFINTSSQRLTLDHESASSTAANRFSLPNSQAFGIAPGASVSVYYDSVVSRWRTISAGIQTEVFAFTLNFTNGCTTTPTMLMSAAKFGNVVSMRINGSMSSCTGDATSFGTSADVPAALIPDANSCFAMGNAASDNGLAVGANFCIQSDGTVVIHECPLDGVAGFGCAASTWTASGTRFLGGLSMVFTYNLDQV